jgi:hypothetical protein
MAEIRGETQGERAGHSVSLSGDGKKLVVGSPYSSYNGVNSGITRTYKYNDDDSNDSNAWVKIQQIDILGKAGGDKSGYSVSLSGDGNTLAIGAINYGYVYNSKPNAGHTRIFKWVNDWGYWYEYNDDPSVIGIRGDVTNDNSGYSVSLSDDGNRLAIGTIGNGGNRGHTRIYKLNNGIAYSMELTGNAAWDKFGHSVSLSGDGNTLAIGAIGSNNRTGYTRIYRYKIGVSEYDIWDPIGRIPGEAYYDESGYSVSLSKNGNTLVIGTPGNDYNGGGSGHTRIYRYNENIEDYWEQIGDVLDGEEPYAKFGHSVSLSGDGKTLAIGAIGSELTQIYTYKYELK